MVKAICYKCAAGKEYTTAVTDCTTCTNGKYQIENDGASVECKTCSPRGHAAETVSSNCEECGAGRYQELEVAEAYQCKFCAAGKEFDKRNTECTPCAAGLYQEQNTR